jgi:N-acetylglucosaminyldiphosphoundecaprenol N-acetyl-beta-D-mannosaminyltransferase
VVNRNVTSQNTATFRALHGIRAVHFLGTRIDTLKLPDLLRVVHGAVRESTRISVMYVNIHTVNLAYRHTYFRELLRGADIVYCDGTGVRLGARLLGLEIPERMTGADWIHDLCRMAVRENLSLFFMGSAAGVAGQAAVALQVRYPGLRVVGWSSGFGLSDGTVRRISDCRPDILLVGMGSPRQERWIAENRNGLEVPVVWAVGALFDFVSGRIPRGPRWMTNHGLEWVCRLAAEPEKLWRRYLIGNPLFLYRVLRSRMKGQSDRFASSDHRPSADQRVP